MKPRGNKVLSNSEWHWRILNPTFLNPTENGKVWATQLPPCPALPITRWTAQEARRGAGRGGSGNCVVPVFIGEHPLAVFALIDLSIAKTFLLDLVTQALVEGADSAASVLLVAPQVELGLEQFIAVLAAERVLFCNTHTKCFWLERQEVQASLIIAPDTELVKRR